MTAIHQTSSLAQYLISCLDAYNIAINDRGRWYGRMDVPGRGSLPFDEATAHSVPTYEGPIDVDWPEVHNYVSTACQHSRHAECRVTCKFCPANCACHDCEHSVLEVDKAAAVLDKTDE